MSLKLILRDYAKIVEQYPDAETLFDPNAVKLVRNVATAEWGDALYFSRAPIPWPRDGASAGITSQTAFGGAWRHVGLYAYRAGFLRRFPQLPPAPLEQHESLEQLRALAHGFGIAVIELPEALPPAACWACTRRSCARLFG